MEQSSTRNAQYINIALASGCMIYVTKYKNLDIVEDIAFKVVSNEFCGWPLRVLVILG